MGIGEDCLPLKAKAVLEPLKHLDLGRGRGQKVETELHGGIVGIILDGRGRNPFSLSEEEDTRIASLKSWMMELDIYPAEAFDRK